MKIGVTLVDRILDSTVSSDGQHLVLWLRTAEDGALPIAVPCDEIHTLIDRCAVASTASEATSRADPPSKDEKMAVTWWNSSVDRPSQEFTLALTFGSGGTLSFAFPERMARALLATLRSHYEPLAAQSQRLPEIAERLRPWRGALLSASRLKRSTLAGQ